MNKQLKQQILVVAFGVTLFCGADESECCGRLFSHLYKHFVTRIFRTAAGIHTKRPDAWHCTAAHRRLSKAERKDG